MGYRGRYQLGQFFPLFCVTRDAAQKPWAPDDVPTAVVFDAAGNKVLTRRLPPLDRFVATGVFGGGLPLAGGFAAGCYRVEYRYTVNAGAYVGLDGDDFEVVGGGSPDGAILSMYFFDRPQAKFLLQQTDAGKLFQGRNPTV